MKPYRNNSRLSEWENFGFYLASALFKKGHEVLGIDIAARKVQGIRDQVSRAVIADATKTPRR
jgi:Trk K+ transport system NAD-binding subunit